jgi:hypothetical protein
VLEKGERNAKVTAARHHKTLIQILEQLAKDVHGTMRKVVLPRSNLLLSSLLELTQYPSVSVRLSLTYKQSQETPTPVQLLERLAQDASEPVRGRVA